MRTTGLTVANFLNNSNWVFFSVNRVLRCKMAAATDGGSPRHTAVSFLSISIAVFICGCFHVSIHPSIHFIDKQERYHQFTSGKSMLNGLLSVFNYGPVRLFGCLVTSGNVRIAFVIDVVERG